MVEWLIALVGLVAAALAALRWLRVVQREQYYLSALRFARRWWLGVPANMLLGAAAVAGVVVALVSPWAALVSALVVAVGPLGLGLRGRSAALAWTPRMVRLGVGLGLVNGLVLLGITLALALLGLAVGHAAAVAATLLAVVQPALADVAALAMRPLEARLMGAFIARAQRRLRQVRPTVVAITGSYGKTGTKGYVRHLLAPVRAVVASPASFNNPGGLSRAINEQLLPGTDVFVAEMGTYGSGEIRELCRWIKPDVAVITAIGPVHLERMGNLDAIVRAKSEILERAATWVLNIDAPGLAEVAARADGQTVWRCSTSDPAADVLASLDDGVLRVIVRGEELARVPGSTAHPANVACAVAVALALDAPPATIAGQLADLPSAEHRLEVASSPHGPTVLDDTYNSNPAGGRVALDRLHALPAGRRVVVTPGMIELGSIQAAENEAFARAAAAIVDDLLIVNRTNRAALLRGAAAGPARRHVFDRREQAVAWVRANLGPTDAVLYENDLPDTYP